MPSTTGRNGLFGNVFLPICDPYGIIGLDSGLAEYATNHLRSNCPVPLGTKYG
jgi:hypothetical protein